MGIYYMVLRLHMKDTNYKCHCKCAITDVFTSLRQIYLLKNNDYSPAYRAPWQSL